MTEKTVHEGRNVKRIREILGVKQDALAIDLGLSQQAISSLEQKEKIDDAILKDVAKILKVPIDAIKNMTDESTSNFFNTFNDNSVNNGLMGDYGTYNFNPVEKWVDALEEIKRLNAALLKEKDEKIALLERLLEKK